MYNNIAMADYVKNKALLGIYAGAGGVDAQDWASMLLKMYHKYSQKKGWSFVILHQSLGEQRGVKSTSVEIKGDGAYDILKNESGVHRLVRISPFSAKKLRHTSFAMVEILPEMVAAGIKINPNDLKFDTFRSSGPGGQNVNKLETAVRVTHLPTGISVAVQSERSQAQNKEKAVQVLYSKLAQRLEKEKANQISELKPNVAIEWGSQIRSYVIHPYQMVKDHRTGAKSSQPEKVLDGDLDKFLGLR